MYTVLCSRLIHLETSCYYFSASDKPDLGLEELQKLNVKERFQVFEHYQTETQESDRSPVNPTPKKSPSILSKLAK